MRAIDTRCAEGLIALTSLKGIGAITAERLAQHFDTLDEISSASPDRLSELASRAIASSLRTPGTLTQASEAAARVLDVAKRLHVHVVSVFDPDYPRALSRLHDRPPVLFIKGNFAALERSIACIGTREPSEFGIQVTQRIVERLVQARWTIVSGLALGIDSIAHQSALHYRGRTVAVLAGGLDNVYPKQNAYLAEEILAQDGALISEQGFGIPATPRNLVQRDRLQSGLSVATFVMQTDVKGGSMHTVRYTLLQGRKVFAPVPQGRHAEEEKSRGILALTRLSGLRLSALLKADGEYKKLLETHYRDHPVACPLANKEEYAGMLRMLEDRLHMDWAAVSGKKVAEQQGLF